MTPSSPLTEGVIWATRGRSWGFRFLLDAGRGDPLPDYERAFGNHDEEDRIVQGDGRVAFRITDPLSRRDASGRLIPHEFVLFGDWAESVDSIEVGVERVWSRVRDVYADVWAAEQPPTRLIVRHRL